VGIALVLTLAVGAAACGSSDETLDHDKLEREIRTQLEQSNRVKGVRCPDDVKSAEGTTFECTATVEGTEQVIDGEVQAKRRVSIALRQ
jgi:hypothetical protein